MATYKLPIIKQEIIDHYTDIYGFMDHCKRDPGEGPASGNGKLYHSQTMILLKRLGDDLSGISKISQEYLGRHPKDINSLEQHDNIIGSVAGSYAVGNDYYCNYMRFTCRLFKKLFFFYTYDNFGSPKIEWNTVLLPHSAFIINFCAKKFWGIINTLWFIGMLLITPNKKHTDGNPDAGVRLVGWTMLQPLVQRFKFMETIEKWYWKKANITDCAKRYYGETPWYELFKMLEDKL